VTRQKGHLRLVEPLPDPCPTCTGPSRTTVGMICPTCGTDYTADYDTEERYTRPTGHPSTWHWAVDTGVGEIQFECPLCGKVQRTDRPVLQRWCTGNSVTTGIRTHVPTEMVRTELSD
jgi:hypothetical protein